VLIKKMAKNQLYQLNNIVQSYNGQTVLNIDSWTVDAHTVTGVAGPNGSGKSTLLALMGFIIAPTAGQVLFDGRPAEPFGDAVRGKVVLMPQESYLLKRSVYRNVAYGLQLAKISGDLRDPVHTAMAMVGLEPELFSRRPWYALSGGETRRVALAARLALRPHVLLMDEPTAGVDVASAQLIKEAALHARRQWGTTLIVTSHDADWLADICDDMLHLFRGRKMGKGQKTLIFGPWQARPDGLVGKVLTDDQDFLAAGTPPDLNAAVATVRARQLGLYPTSHPAPPGYHCLEGILLRLSYEQITHHTSAAVLVGRTVLTAYLPDPPHDAGFAPGQKVRIAYSPQAVEWH
jgi:tungstate transport system ATP-binding protein